MRPVFFSRRMVGTSMMPKLKPGQLIIATGLFHKLEPGEVVIVEHQGKQKIKRIERISDEKVFVIGDNLQTSNDSRHFGWVEQKEIIARVLFPRLAK